MKKETNLIISALGSAELTQIYSGNLGNPDLHETKRYITTDFRWLNGETPVTFLLDQNEDESVNVFSSRPIWPGQTVISQRVVDGLRMRHEPLIYDHKNSRHINQRTVSGIINLGIYGGFLVKDSESNVQHLQASLVVEPARSRHQNGMNISAA